MATCLTHLVYHNTSNPTSCFARAIGQRFKDIEGIMHYIPEATKEQVNAMLKRFGAFQEIDRRTMSDALKD